MLYSIFLKCTGSLTSDDTCITGTGGVETAPLCGTATYGKLGVCGKCQANSDGSGGDGSGEWGQPTGKGQGTCQNEGHFCCSDGACRMSCGNATCIC